MPNESKLNGNLCIFIGHFFNRHMYNRMSLTPFVANGKVLLEEDEEEEEEDKKEEVLAN